MHKSVSTSLEAIRGRSLSTQIKRRKNLWYRRTGNYAGAPEILRTAVDNLLNERSHPHVRIERSQIFFGRLQMRHFRDCRQR